MDIGQALIRISEQVLEDPDPQHAYRQIVQITLDEFQADYTGLMLWNKDTGHVSLVASAGMAYATPEDVLGPACSRLADWVLSQRIPLLLPGDDTTASEFRDLLRDSHMHTAMWAPVVGPNQPIGVLLIARRRERAAFTTADCDMLLLLAQQAAITIAHAWRDHHALHDAAQYRALLDHASDAVLLIDSKTLRIVEVNPAAEALSGYSRRELRDIPPANLIVGELFEGQPAPRAKILTSDGPEVEAHLRTRGGREIPISVGLSTFEHGATQYLLLIARDMGERQRATQRVVQTEKLAGMGRLATSIAHEINNPLQAIHNSLHLALNRPLSEEKRDRYLTMAHEEVERLITMVQRMLDFYRPSRDGMRPISLHAILENVLSMAAEQFQEGSIVVERQWDERLPWVKGIGSHLKQVFLNLALNAIEAMPDGGRLTIRTRVEAGSSSLAERFVLVEFIDTGPGIPDHEAQTIFEPFYTTKHKGPGLGLAISYSIVERHEGTLSVSSGDSGTTFRVALPAIEGSELVS